MLNPVEVSAARKISKFLRMCQRVRLAFEARFQEVLLASVLKIQRNFRRLRLRLLAKKRKIYRA